MLFFSMGIDVGGSYTDVALVDSATSNVVACSKVPTDHKNPLQSVERAIASAVSDLDGRCAYEICSVSLCTTFATNALVEGEFHPAALVLIGYPDELIKEIRVKTLKLRELSIVSVNGGHDGMGNQREPLYVASLESQIFAVLGEVEAFGVSGFFSIRNPKHEIAVRDFIENYCSKPTVCGFELPLVPNSVHRAITTALNASLIPLVTNMIKNVKACIARYAKGAPLMIVSSDGTLMSSEWAMHRPIETILSGPAASALGGVHLAKNALDRSTSLDCLVMDMGGTTTDVISIKNGCAVLLQHGASVGDFQLAVQSIDVRTLGLGGDSQIVVGGNNEIQIGPERAIPLHKADKSFTTNGLIKEGHRDSVDWQQLIALNELSSEVSDEGSWRIVSKLIPNRIVSKEVLHDFFDDAESAERALKRLLRSHLADSFAFTPSDALVLLGRMPSDNAAISSEMAGHLAALFGCADGREFSQKVFELLVEKLTILATEKILLNTGLSTRWISDLETQALLRKIVLKNTPVPLASFLTDKPVIVVGAPMTHYAESLSKRLGIPAINPAYGEAAGAVGAAVGAHHLKGAVLIRFLSDKNTYRAHLPWGIEDYASLEEAIKTTNEQMEKHLKRIAKKLDVVEGEIESESTRDEIVLKNGEIVYFGTYVTYWMPLGNYNEMRLRQR